MENDRHHDQTDPSLHRGERSVPVLDYLASSARRERLPERGIDAVFHESHRTVSHQQVHAAHVLAARARQPYGVKITLTSPNELPMQSGVGSFGR